MTSQFLSMIISENFYHFTQITWQISLSDQSLVTFALPTGIGLKEIYQGWLSLEDVVYKLSDMSMKQRNLKKLQQQKIIFPQKIQYQFQMKEKKEDFKNKIFLMNCKIYILNDLNHHHQQEQVLQNYHQNNCF